MPALKTTNTPKVRGEAVIRVIGPDGACKQEVKGKNLLNNRFWDSIVNGESSVWNNGNQSLFLVRTYIGADKHVPYPQESYAWMLGEGTDHPQGVFRTGSEPITDYPYIQIRNLYQVTGTARTIYSIGLTNNTGVPENNISEYRLATSRLLLPEPVVQGENDQLDLIYRLYFEEDPYSDTHPAYWAFIVYWAMTSTASTYLGHTEARYYGHVIGMGGVGYAQTRASFNLPVVAGVSSDYAGSFLRTLDYTMFGRAEDRTNNRNGTASIYYWANRFRTNRTYFWGDLFNEWWPRDYGIDLRNADWLGSQSGYLGSFAYGGYLRRLSKFYKSETSSTGPFHNSFNHKSDSMSLIYDVNGLPQTTWRALFKGTWPTEDRIPLFARLWWSSGGPLNGVAARYKLAFVRTLGTPKGRAEDQLVSYWGNAEQGAIETYNYNSRRFPGQNIWTHNTDLMAGHTEFKNSRFGNLGCYNRSGTAGFNTGHAFGSATRLKAFNIRKMPGLTMNTWWGWQSGKYGKSNHLGVEWRQLHPLVRKVWQKEDISPNLGQIDWLETCNGLAGEVDDEMALICDKTSGIYLINATQDTVTQITSKTGFDQCSFARDKDSGEIIYTAIKFTGNRTIITDSTISFEDTVGLLDYNGEIGGSGTLTDNLDANGWYGFQDTSRYGAITTGFGNGQWPKIVNAFGSFNNKGAVRSVFYSDGSDDQYVIQPNYTSRFVLSSDFTIELWLYKQGHDQYDYIFDIGSNTCAPGDASGALVLNTGYEFGLRVAGVQTLPLFTTSDRFKWIHVAIVRQAGTITVYRDGIVHSTIQNNNTINPNNNNIGLFEEYNRCWTNRCHNGYIHSLRITKAARYTGEFTPYDFTLDDGNEDPLYQQTVLLLTAEKNPLSISAASFNLVDGLYENLNLTGTGAGVGGKATAYVQNGVLSRVAISSRGTGYSPGETCTLTLPVQQNPEFGKITQLDQGSLVPGSNYVDGSYTVNLQLGSGTGATATVIVTAGQVSSVTLLNGGSGYQAGDLLTANNANLGNAGTGAGFSIEVATIVAQQFKETVPATVQVNSTLSKANTVYKQYESNIIMLRRHWRHPDVAVALARNGSYLITFVQFISGGNEIETASSGNIDPYYSAAIGEFFGDQGENASGITIKELDSFTTGDFRELVWADWIAFEPNGLYARVQAIDGYSAGFSIADNHCWFVRTHASYDNSRYHTEEDSGKMPWCAPHSIVAIPNAENPQFPHYVIGNATDADGSLSQYGHWPDQNPFIFRGSDRTTTVGTWSQRGDVISNMVTNRTSDHINQGYWEYALPKQGASVSYNYDDKGQGRYLEDGVEPYKGLAVDGQVMSFYAPMWCRRDSGNTASHNPGRPAAWPIDSDNDSVIPHPLRWDIYGWDSANNSWVREEWAYNYTLHKWVVDPTTVFPGRAAPNGGGTHSLSSIEKYPYNNLEVEFVNVRPEDTNDPIQGEWSGQYIYNGNVFDGINEFTFIQSVTSRPMRFSAISQVIPASGRIRVPESYDDTFIWLNRYDPNLHDLKINGTAAPVVYGTYEYSLPGYVNVSHYQLIFDQADVGKTLTGTYCYLKHPDSESPRDYVQFVFGRENAPDGTLDGLLGGAAKKTSATLVSEGWTLQASGNTFAFVNISSFIDVLPNGFPSFREHSPFIEDAEYAQRLFFSRDCIGFFLQDAATNITTYRDYGSDNNSSGNPTYGGVQFIYHDNHQLVDVHSIRYTSPSGDEYIIIRAQWNYNGSASQDINCELWININDPWRYEWRIGNWNSLNSNYSGTTRHMGRTRRSNGGSYWVPPILWPYGLASTYNSTTDTASFTPWGGQPSEWANQKFLLDFDPHGYEDP